MKISCRTWVLALLAGVIISPAIASDAASDTPKQPAAGAPGAALDAHALAARIDLHISQRLKAENVKPAAQAGDAEFFRRVHLDLAGRIPRAADVRDFLDDPAPDKRRRVIENLLDSPHFVNHFTNVWRFLLLPQNNNVQVQPLVPGFEAWLRERIRDNMPYDKLVREILTSATEPSRRMRQQMNAKVEPTPVAFYQANESKPENLAASTSRLFLGVKIECAQCHDHPHDKWTRTQFWEYANFFAGLQREPPTKVVPARFLDGNDPKLDTGIQPRTALANWITANDNPYFARNAANRMWEHFFGMGIIDPVDEVGVQNPPSHPELLKELSQQISLHQFDQKYIIRAITNSQAYQRTSAGAKQTPDQARLFARMPVRGLSPEQLFDSLIQATGFREGALGYSPADPFGNNNSLRVQFLSKFTSQDRPTEFHTSILQALALMNGKFMDDATSLERSETLAAVTDVPFMDRPKKIETLYLAALSRKPRPEEISRLVKHVTENTGKDAEKIALADVFWALLNSAEFMLNH